MTDTRLLVRLRSVLEYRLPVAGLAVRSALLADTGGAGQARACLRELRGDATDSAGSEALASAQSPDCSTDALVSAFSNLRSAMRAHRAALVERWVRHLISDVLQPLLETDRLVRARLASGVAATTLAAELERALERLRQLDAPTVARPEAVQLAYERLAEAMCDAKRGASHRALRERADAFERTLDADDRAAMREATCRLERVLARQNALKGAIASGQAQQCTAHARSHQPARTRTHTHDTHDTHDTR